MSLFSIYIIINVSLFRASESGLPNLIWLTDSASNLSCNYIKWSCAKYGKIMFANPVKNAQYCHAKLNLNFNLWTIWLQSQKRMPTYTEAKQCGMQAGKNADDKTASPILMRKINLNVWKTLLAGRCGTLGRVPEILHAGDCDRRRPGRWRRWLIVVSTRIIQYPSYVQQLQQDNLHDYKIRK